MYKIISDGGCDFTAKQARDIEVVPFYLAFGSEPHLREGIDISREEYFERLVSEKNIFPTTAQPSPQDYIDVYTPHLAAGRDILVLTISSKLSGSNNSATLAASMIKEEFPERTIQVLDSKSASVGQGLILREMIKMQHAGYSLRENAAYAQKIIDSTRVYFTLETLEYLKRGGRVGPTTALVGGILGLRPILQLDEGEISQMDSVRGKKNALRLIHEGLLDALQDETENIHLSIGYISTPQEAADFQTGIFSALEMHPSTPVVAVGAAIGTHTGPGALAFAYCKRYEVFVAEKIAARKAA